MSLQHKDWVWTMYVHNIFKCQEKERPFTDEKDSTSYWYKMQLESSLGFLSVKLE